MSVCLPACTTSADTFMKCQRQCDIIQRLLLSNPFIHFINLQFIALEGWILIGIYWQTTLKHTLSMTFNESNCYCYCKYLTYLNHLLLSDLDLVLFIQIFVKVSDEIIIIQLTSCFFYFCELLTYFYGNS